MSWIYGDTFDSYASADLGLRYSSFDSGRVTIGSGNGRDGTNALHFSSSAGGYVYRGIPRSSSAIRTTHFAYKGAAGITSQTLLSHVDAVNSASHFTLVLNTNGSLSLYRNPAGIGPLSTFSSTVICTTPSALITGGAWAHIAVEAKIHGSAGYVKIYVNSAEKASFTGQTSANGDLSVDEVAVGGYDCDIDDLIITDDVDIGDGVSAYLGDLIGERSLILLNGSTMTWTPNTGTAHAAVDDVTPDGDATTIASNTVGQVALFTHGALTRIDSGIRCVQASSVAKKDTGGTRAITHRAHSGSTDTDGDDSYLGTSNQAHITPFTKDPDTSSQWTAAGVDAAEFGPKVSV